MSAQAAILFIFTQSSNVISPVSAPPVRRIVVLQSTVSVAVLLLLALSCAPVKYVPEGEYLLSRNRVYMQKAVVPESQLKSYIIQKPNKKLLGLRFYLFLYNLTNINKEKWPHNWLRKIGEEPVIYDPSKTENSVERLGQYLENKGYYHARVLDSVVYKRKNASVHYWIEPREPYRIRSFDCVFEDSSLEPLVMSDTANSLVEVGAVFDKDVLQNERIRIESLLRENGYYRFSKEYVYFQADIDEAQNAVDVTLRIREFIEGQTNPFTGQKHHPKYTIGNIYIYPNTNILAEAGSSAPSAPDTFEYEGQYFISGSKIRLKPSVIVNSSYLIPGRYYRLSDVDRTYKNLSSLGLIRYTNIAFRERDSLDRSVEDNLLDCRIELTQKNVQSYQTEVAGTNSAGDLGIRGNLLYQNLNVFRGAEVFNLRFTAAIEALKNRSNKEFTSMKEFGVESAILFPKFFSPFRLERFVRQYSPKTSLSLSYNHQSRPDYTRSIFNGSFSYRWNGNAYLSHTLVPLELNYVQIYEDQSDAVFIDSIRKTPIGYSFEDHLVSMTRYGFELNNQRIGQRKDFYFLRFNVESAGNLASLASRIGSEGTAAGTGLLFNVPYFQYMRGDIEFRYYDIMNVKNRMVYRVYAGLGYSYGNSRALPFEKKFFSGGPNSIRAWSTRDLGPGSFAEPDTLNEVFFFPNKTGDIKLEANIEYRFKVVWKLESAVFLDMGNIWAARDETGREDATFRWNRFYKEIAVGTGFGLRFDFSFLLVRFDFGIQLRDPALPEDSRWVPLFRDFNLNDLHLKFGIGYPF